MDHAFLSSRRLGIAIATLIPCRTQLRPIRPLNLPFR
jgi:hypothetical protein